MLPRSVARSLGANVGKHRNLVSSQRCLEPCLCACGTSFIPRLDFVNKFEQRRSVVKGKRHPSTWKKVMDLESRPVRPANIHQQPNEEDIAWQREWLDQYWFPTFALAQGIKKIDPNRHREFLDALEQLMKERRGGAVALNVAHFQDMVNSFGGAEFEQLEQMAKVLVRQKWWAPWRELGTALYYTLAEMDYEEAIIRLVYNGITAELKKPGALRRPELLIARKRLKTFIANNKGSPTVHRAMVLEGQVSQAMGDDSHAIKMWEDALEGASKYKAVDQRQLSQPWIDLTLLHYKRYSQFLRTGEDKHNPKADEEYEKARAAADFGWKLDDPTSHFHAADYFQEKDARGALMTTSKWLYHMMKAACSLHVEAMFRIGEFYATSVWKYLDDEPPNHVKPTPFDSFPPSKAAWAPVADSLRYLRRFFGLPVSITANDPKPSDDLFHTAFWPHDPPARVALAKRWLGLSRDFGYGPAALRLAQISAMTHAEKVEMWNEVRVPDSAINMTEERYTYASEADRDAGDKIDRGEPEATAGDSTKAVNHSVDDQLSTDNAQNMLRETFYAIEAARLYQKLNGRNTGTRGAVDTDGRAQYREATRQDPKLAMYFVNRDVIESWVDQADYMEREARAICDKHGWDIYSDKNVLLYKCGLKRASTDYQVHLSKISRARG